MKDFLAYKIIPELKLIIEFIYGTLNYENGVAVKKMEIQDKDYNPGYNFLVDYTHCRISYTDADLLKYVRDLRDNPLIIGNRKSAMITKTPAHVVFNTLYTEALKEFPMKFKIFSSIPAAMDWIDIPEAHEDMILSVINGWINEAVKI